MGPSVTSSVGLPLVMSVSCRPAHPRLRDIVARVAVSLAAAVVAPAALFATTLLVFDITIAVLAALAWMASAMCWRRVTSRPVSGLLVLALGIMTLKTAVMLATGDAFIYFVQPVVLDLLVAAAFLGSLGSARPIVARLAPDFYPVDAELAARPRIRRLFRGLTLFWGLVILAKGSVTLWLLISLSTVEFVLIKGSAILTLTVLAIATTMAWSVVVARREGLLPARGYARPAPDPRATMARLSVEVLPEPSAAVVR